MDRYNAEGYADPTAYEALTAGAKPKKVYKPLVYISSPFAGDTETNIKKAQEYCRFAVAQHCIPIAPHLHYPQFMDDNDRCERKLGLFFALVLLGKCDELWVFGDSITRGMMREIAKGKKRSIPIKRFNSECEEIFLCVT